MTNTVHACLGIGSNLDHPLEQVTRAVQALDHTPGIQVSRLSRWYGSKAIGPGTQPDYVNGVVEITTSLSPAALLEALQAIEHRHGRIRTEHWGARTLDLDILFYDDQQILTPDLQIPHPRIHERRFVLQPLADLTPDRRVWCPSSKKMRQLPTC